MTHHKWLKMPDGKLVKHTPDRLAMSLAEPLMDLTPWSFPTPPDAHRAGPPDGYATESFDVRRLHGHRVTVIGAGSVASHSAYAVGPAGLVMDIIDPGIVQPRHTSAGRTIYDPTFIGSKKVHAAKQKIERDFPGTTVNPFPYNTAEIPDTEFRSMFARSGLVILAIDDPAQMLRISDLAYPLTEMVQVGMHRRAESGHISLSVPFVTPCLRCTLGIAGPEDIHRLASEPANSWDIITVAQLAARLVIDVLYSKVSGQEITRWDPSKNLIYIANTRQEISPNGPGIHFEASQKRPGCPICNTSLPH